jgi:AraC-like DNA-binding protein
MLPPSLRAPKSQEPESLKALRDEVLARTRGEGRTVVDGPDLCFFRFSRPATLTKVTTFGVTVGVVLQGSKKLRVEGHELNVAPPGVLVVTRETENETTLLPAGPDRPHLSLFLCFDPEHVARALVTLSEAAGPPAPEVVPAFQLPYDQRLVDTLRRLVASIDDPIERKLLAPLAAQEILLRLLRSDAAAAVRSGVGRAADAGKILEAMQFIRAHSAEGLTVPAIARRVGMSPSHFAHRFRAVARVSPMRYLRDVRLEQARARLLHASARVGDVARDLGYESQAHFAREFKRRYGAPPTQYVRLLTER